MIAWHQIADTREPRPELLGLELELFPYPSAFSLLLRVSRITALGPTEWFRSVGIRFGTQGMGLAEFRAGRVSRARFELAMGVAGTQIPTWWSEEAWSPMDTSGALDQLVRPVRGCTECAAYGYHTMLFQLPSILRCPWHDRDLVDVCPKCHLSIFSHPDGEGRLGHCGCRNDCIDIDQATIRMRSFPTAQAERWLSGYLDWVGSQRCQRRFVAPDDNQRWLEGFAMLAEPPQALALASGRPQFVGSRVLSTCDEHASDPPNSKFWGWAALADRHPLTFVPLPSTTHEALLKATQKVVAGFPSNTRTPIQLVSANGFDGQATLTENASRRPECFITPLSRSADGSGWLDVSAVDGGTVQLCGKLMDAVVARCAPEPEDGDLSRQAVRTAALGRVSGRCNLAIALEKMLLQGYTQGLDSLLRASLGLPRTDGWLLPVAELVGEQGCLTNIRICWVKVPAPRLRRASESALDGPCEAAKKRPRANRNRRYKPRKRATV